MSSQPTPPDGHRSRAAESRQPLLWAAFAFAAGILLGSCAWRPPLWWALATVGFLAAAAYFVLERAWVSKALALATLFLIGAFSSQIRGGGNSPDLEILRFADGREVVITAHVIAEGRIRAASFGGVRQSLDLETEEITSGADTINIRSGLRLGVYAKQIKEEYQDENSRSMRIYRYGERLRFPAKLRPPRNFRNPGAFDYQGYLAENGIVVLGSAKAESIEPLPGFVGSRIELLRTRIHRSAIEKIHALWPPAEAALIDAMVIGEAAFIDRDTRADFQRSGTYHILVVSGMNVSILAFVIFWVLKRIRLGEIAASILTVLLSIAYALLTDVGAPIWRATLMMMLYLGARLLYRERSMLNALGAAAFALLVLDPHELFGASFQLTFLSVLIIAAIGIPILERTSQPYSRGLRHLSSPDYDLSLPPRVAQFRLDLRMINARLARFLGARIPLRMIGGGASALLATFEVLFISALMQVGLALPMAYYFHRATVVGFPANGLVVPLTGVLMPAAVLAVALGYISLVLAKLPALIAAASIEGITGTVRILGGLRIADLRVPTPGLLVIVAGAGALAAAMVLSRRRRALAYRGLLLLTAVAGWIALLPPHPQVRPGALELTAIDVGQGDSLLLVAPEGTTMLVDAGGPIGGQRSELDFGEDVVSPYLWSRGFSHLNVVAITHAHSDHIGGMHAILKNFRPRELWVGVIPPSAELSRLLQQAKEEGITLVQHFEGDTLNFGGSTVRVLSPVRDWEIANQPRNNDSLVLHFTYRQSSALLEGDAEKKIEERVAAQHPRADLLKIGHHGGLTSTIPELLQAVQPRIAIISVGARNTFGHPRIEVLQRLADSGVSTYRTDLDGAVTFYLDGRSVTPQLSNHH